MNETYEYMDEESINKDLICSICELPFNDPSYAPCGETFCHQCITRWVQRGNNSCPHCRQPLLTTALRRTPRSLRNMLDRLQVKCIACGQTEINRGNFDDHIQKVCPKTIVSCPSEDSKCPWRGQRDQIHQHLVDCRFVPMRAIITQLINENQKLLNLVDQHTTQTVEKENVMKKLLETSEQQEIQIGTHEKEKQQWRDLVNQQTIKIARQQEMLKKSLQVLEQQKIQIEKNQIDNQQLKDLVNIQTKEIVAQQNMIKRIVENQEQHIFQINTYRKENQQVKDQVNQQIVHIDAQRKEIRRLEKQVKQKGTQMTTMSHPSGE